MQTQRKPIDQQLVKRAMEMIRAREMQRKIIVWVKLVLGAILLVVVGMIGAGLLSAPFATSGLALPIYAAILVVVIGVLLLSAKTLNSSAFEDESRWIQPEVNGLGVAHYDSSGERQLVLGRLTLAVIADIALFPAVWVVRGIEEIRFIARLGPMNVTRAAEVVVKLHLNGKGMTLASLALAGEPPESLRRMTVRLRHLGMVDLSDKRDLIWVPSRISDQLK